MNLSLSFIREVIRDQLVKPFYLLDPNGNEHQVYDITDDKDFVIADEDGIRKVVEVHPEGCDCGETTYLLPRVVMDQVINLQVKRSMQADHQLLDAFKADIFKTEDDFKKGSYVTLKSEYFETAEGPRFGDLVLVHSQYRPTGVSINFIVGYTNQDRCIVMVKDEAWRYRAVDPSELI